MNDRHPVPLRMRLAFAGRYQRFGELRSDAVIAECYAFHDVELDETRLRAAFQTALREHATLRTRFFFDPEQGASQEVGPVYDPVVRVEVPARGAEAVLDVARGLASAASATPFEMGSGHLLTVTFVTDGGRDHVLLIAGERIVCDGLSLASFLHTVESAYDAATVNPEPYSLVEYAYLERAFLESNGAALRQAWRQRLGERIPEMPLVVDRPYTELTIDGAPAGTRLEGERYQRFKAAATKSRVTPFTLAAARLLDALRPAMAGERISFITPLAGRVPGTPLSLVGNLVNLLPVTVECPRDAPFDELLVATRNGLLWALRHQMLPFPEIANEIDPGGSVNTNDRRQICISGQQDEPFRLAGVTATTPFQMVPSTAIFDLSVWLTEDFRSLVADAVYRTDILTRPVVDGWLAAL